MNTIIKIIAYSLGVCTHISVIAADNPCTSNWQWVWDTTPPPLTIDGPSSHPDCCVGIQQSVGPVSISPDPLTGVKKEIDLNECPPGPYERNQQSVTVSTWIEWSLYFNGTATPLDGTSGNPATAVFTPLTANSSGLLEVQFKGRASRTAAPGWDDSSPVLKVPLNVFQVESLLPSGGPTELDDLDGNVDTKTFVLCDTSSGSIVVDAVPNVPNITMSSQLPNCWTLTGGTGTSRLYRTIDRSTEGSYTLVATAGTSQKTTKIYVSKLIDIVFKRADEATSLYASDGGGDIIHNKDFSFKIFSSTGTHDGIMEWDLWDLDYTDELLATGSGAETTQNMHDLGSTRIRFWVDAVRNGNYDSGECSMSKTFEVVTPTVRSFTVSRHTATSITTTAIDNYFAAATELLQKRDIGDDIRCAVTFQRSGSVSTFNVGDGYIDSDTEENNVFNVNANIKWVNGTDRGYTGIAILGSKNIILTLGANANTLAHEIGHTLNLGHDNNISHRIMWGTFSSTKNTISQTDYSHYR